MTIDRALRTVDSKNLVNFSNRNFLSQEQDRRSISQKILAYMCKDKSGIWEIIKSNGLINKFINWLNTVAGPVVGWISKIVCEGAFTYLLAGVGNAFLSVSKVRGVQNTNSFNSQNYYNPNQNNAFVNSNGSGYTPPASEFRSAIIPKNNVTQPSWLDNSLSTTPFKFS